MPAENAVRRIPIVTNPHPFFHGGVSGPPMVKPYTLNEVAAVLNAVTPNDWRSFLEARVYRIAPHPPLNAFEQAGWRRLLDQAFEKRISLRLLFRDEQRKIAKIILNESLTSAAAVHRTIFENQAPLLRFLTGLSIPVPNALRAAAEIALNNQLEQLFERPELDTDSILGLLKETAATNIPLDAATLEYAIRRRIEKEAAEFAVNPRDPAAAERLRKSLDLIPSLPFPVTLWEVQNIGYPALAKVFEENGLEAREHDPALRWWAQPV